MADPDALHSCETGDLPALQRYTESVQSMDPEIVQELTTQAIKKKQIEIVQFLLDSYPEVPLSEDSVLYACYIGSIPLLSVLLAKDHTIPNYGFDQRGTPLAIATGFGTSFEFIQFLLENGADPDEGDIHPCPLGGAAHRYSTPEVVELLIKHGARLEGSHALMFASSYGHLEVVKYLLEIGANPQTDPNPTNPELALVAALRNGHEEIVKLLLEHGADLNARNYKGETAWDVAKGQQKWIDILGGNAELR